MFETRRMAPALPCRHPEPPPPDFAVAVRLRLGGVGAAGTPARTERSVGPSPGQAAKSVTVAATTAPGMATEAGGGWRGGSGGELEDREGGRARAMAAGFWRLRHAVNWSRRLESSRSKKMKTQYG